MANWEDGFRYEDKGLSFFLTGIKNFWKLVGPEQRAMKLGFYWLIVTQLLALAFPYFLKLIFDDLPEVLKSGTISTRLICFIIIMFAVKISAILVTLFVKETIFIKGVIRLEAWWPVLAQSKLLALSLGYHERENTGKKISKIEKGIERMVEICVKLSWDILPQFIYLVANLTCMMILDWRLGLLFFLPFAPAYWINKRYYERMSGDWEKWEKKKEESSGYFTQSLLNIRTVQDFVQERREKERLQTVRECMRDLDTDINMTERYYIMGIRIVLNVFFLATIALGVYFVLMGQTKVGTVVFIITTGNVTIEGLGEIFNNYSKILRNLVSVNRLTEIMNDDTEITNSSTAFVPTTTIGDIRFDKISFNYPGKDQAVLEFFDLQIAPRQMIALVGRSGEGKTTVAKLLCRVYDVNHGRITLDGIDIRQLDRDWYRRLFAIVQQDVDVFDATLLENITYACRDATPAQVDEAIRAAHIHTMMEKQDRFPDGLATQVGERGIRLSGGERQRVGIARAYIALLNGAKFLVLDEATSSLDSETELAIQSMLNSIRKKLDVSIVAIAHRLSTIRKADMIYVIDGGQVAESGSHEKLLAQNGLYSRLVELQKLGDLRK